MAPRLKLESEESQRSPEREQLAKAAERHVLLTKHFAAFKFALAKIWGDIQIAKREVSAAEKQVEQAKAAASAHRVDEVLGKDSPEPSITVADARRAHEQAEDKLAELDAAQLKLHLDESEIAAQLEVSNINLRDCVSAVVRTDPATADLVKHLEITRARFVSLNSAVDYLAANNCAPSQSLHMVPATLDVEQEWRLAVAALMAGDPDAVLPAILQDE